MMFFVVIVILLSPTESYSYMEIKEFNAKKYCQRYAVQQAQDFLDTGAVIMVDGACVLINNNRII